MKLAAIRKKAEKDIPDVAYTGEEINELSIKRIPSGIFTFDLCTGGGIPENRYTIFKGAKSSSKSNIAFQYIGAYQRMYPEKTVVYMDFEQTFIAEWANNFYDDQDKLLLVTPPYGEWGVDAVGEYALADEVGLVIIDSLASIIPTKMSDADAGDDHVGLQVKLINKMIRKLNPTMANSRRDGRNLTVLMINQVRANIGAMRFGPTQHDPCGYYKDHMSAMDIRFYPAKYTKSKDIPYKATHKFVIDKNKCGIPKLVGEYTMYIRGHNGHEVGEIEQSKQILKYALDTGVIKKEGNQLIIDGIPNASFPSQAQLLIELDEDKRLEKVLGDLTVSTFLSQLDNQIDIDEEDINDAVDL